jgi:hypothetical protein
VAARPTTVCLVPARNAEHHLPACLDSAARFADAIVALDDGSTDDTWAVLKTSPHVAIVLSNPPRPSYEGWDDSANRNRLLRAAAQLAPSWIVSLDADERVPPDDAAALREFITTDALPGCAYGFQHFRMWGNECVPHFTWIYRLFSFRKEQAFPARRLHFDPVSTDIHRERWVRTTIRVQHVGASDEEGRLAHVAKYRQADPTAEYGVNFGGLAERPATLRAWHARPPGLPVLAPPEWAIAASARTHRLEDGSPPAGSGVVSPSQAR